MKRCVLRPVIGADGVVKEEYVVEDALLILDVTPTSKALPAPAQTIGRTSTESA